MAEKNKDISIKTIYIGGGTPSYIDSKYIVENGVDIPEVVNFKWHGKKK